MKKYEIRTEQREIKIDSSFRLEQGILYPGEDCETIATFSSEEDAKAFFAKQNYHSYANEFDYPAGRLMVVEEFWIEEIEYECDEDGDEIFSELCGAVKISDFPAGSTYQYAAL